MSEVSEQTYRTSYQRLVDQDVIEPFTDGERSRWNAPERRRSTYMPMLAYLELAGPEPAESVACGGLNERGRK